jgi:hypothetical protein
MRLIVGNTVDGAPVSPGVDGPLGVDETSNGTTEADAVSVADAATLKAAIGLNAMIPTRAAATFLLNFIA